jgi:hypothetical protein
MAASSDADGGTILIAAGAARSSIMIERPRTAVRKIHPFDSRTECWCAGRIELDDQFGAASETGTCDESAIYLGLDL